MLRNGHDGSVMAAMEAWTKYHYLSTTKNSEFSGGTDDFFVLSIHCIILKFGVICGQYLKTLSLSSRSIVSK